MIMVDVYFPAVDQSYGFKLDENVKIIFLIQEMREMMCKKYKSVVESQDDQLMLCTLSGQRVLPNDTTLAQNEIMNGERLMLV